LPRPLLERDQAARPLAEHFTWDVPASSLSRDRTEELDREVSVDVAGEESFQRVDDFSVEL
jgi:hypothetical protein